jgi:drug/metabolite transporter (DMT)-like permease
MNARPLAWLALAQLAIGAAAIFVRLALTATGPLWIAALRMGIAGSVVALAAAWRGRYAPIDPPTERRLLIAGAILALHFASWFAALQHASVAVATLLVCSTPVFTEAWTILRTRVWRPAALTSIALAAGGTAIVAGIPSRTETPLGIALAVCGAIALAAYLLLVRASDARYTTLAVVGRTYPVAALLLLAAALASHEPFPPAGSRAAWAGIAALALVSQLFGHTALNAAVRALSATFVATTTLLEPVIAAIAAAWIFNERPGPGTAAGAGVILLAIALAIRAESSGDGNRGCPSSTSSG